MDSETQPIEHSGSSACSSAKCDECESRAVKIVRDACNIQHCFCEKHWQEHVAFAGNDGKPYGL